MKTICLYFQIHQPFRFRRYRFFDIGNDHYYYDDYLNESIMQKVASRGYLKANKILLEIIKEYGCKFKVAFSITGIALDQMELYAPEVLESFKELNETGCVEFLGETYSHSLASLNSNEEFTKQVKEHSERIALLFGQPPKIFRNTELIYSDDIGDKVAKLGFEAMITEGAKHILGWKSSNFLYHNTINPRLKILLKNFKLSDDIAFRFSNSSWSEWPLTAEKYVKWLKQLDKKEEIINLFMDYETFGEHQPAESGIFDFLRAFPRVVFKKSGYEFYTPSEVVKIHQSVGAVHVPYPISWADAERDLTAWLGNELQQDAFHKLYSLTDKMAKCEHEILLKDWRYLQSSDHFYYMCTKFFSDGEVHMYFNPYESPYDAYINYMNILSDFSLRLNALVPETSNDFEMANLNRTIEEKDRLIEKYREELKKMKEAGKRSAEGPKKSVKGRKTRNKKSISSSVQKEGKSKKK